MYEYQDIDFETKFSDIAFMNRDVMTQTNKKVEFNKNKAVSKGYHNQSIKLADELADFSNYLVENQDWNNVNLSNYPTVKTFFESARKTKIKPALEATSVFKKRYGGNIKANASVSDISSYIALKDVIARSECGSYGNDRPDKVLEYKTHHSNNPEQTLKDWGYYHDPIDRKTVKIFTGTGGVTFTSGWSRNVTWNPLICGVSTFRDNALPYFDASYNNSCCHLIEQNYEGWTPRGEPNPNVQWSGPWPYADWPAYVFFWHQKY